MILDRFAHSSRLAPFLLAALVGVGCMQSDTKTTILADGSGTCSDTIVIDIAKTKEIIEALKMFGQMSGGGGGGGGPGGIGGLGSIPQNLDVEKLLESQYSEAALKAQLAATPGVVTKAVSSEVKDGKRTSKREFAFADFPALSHLVFQTGTAELKKNDDGSWTLEMDAIGLLRGMLGAAGDAPGGAAGGAAGGFSSADLLGMVGQMLGDFRMKRQFTLPGSIVETDGTKSEDGKSVSWTFATEDLSKAGTDASKVPGKMSVRFKGEGLLLKPFKYAPDLKEMMKSMQPKPAAPATPTTPGEPTKPGEPATPVGPAKPPEPVTPTPAK
jgi:hypothetical protein